MAKITDNSDCLYIFAPAYNEELNIEQFIAEWHPIVEQFGNADSRLVIVNDGSTDQTEAVCKKLKSKYPKLEVVTKPNGGHGSSVLYGYNYAIKHKADYIFQTDSDRQTNPAEFETFWRLRDRYDAIFGHRTIRGDGQGRAFVEKTLCRIVKHYFKVNVPDANAPFRLMTRDYVEHFIKYIPDNYNLPNVILTALGVRFEQRVLFASISFKPRRAGKNTINLKKIAKIGYQALGDFARIGKDIDARKFEG